jgi:hypothetical protein
MFLHYNGGRLFPHHGGKLYKSHMNFCKAAREEARRSLRRRERVHAVGTARVDELYKSCV